MKFRFIAYILFFSILSISCSPQKRIARIAEKYNLYSIDTLHYKDTIFIPAKNIQTVSILDTANNFRYQSGDIGYQGYILKDSLVFLTITIPADTVFIDKKIPTTKIEVKPPAKQPFNIWFWLFVVGFGFVLINKIVEKWRQH